MNNWRYAQADQELAFTQDEMAEQERARTMPITFDEDCPEMTPERTLRFRRVNPVGCNRSLTHT